MIQQWWSNARRSAQTSRHYRVAASGAPDEENVRDDRGHGARRLGRASAAIIVAGTLVAACGDSNSDADADTGSLYTLGIQTGDEMTFEDERLSFTSGESVRWFSDRPARLVGSVPLEEFVALWDDGRTFHDDPPNAALVVDDEDPIVVELVGVKVGADTVTYDARTLLGEVPASSAKVTLVIDHSCMVDPLDC